MTTDPISLPALTPFELFEQLKTKGYQPRPCGDHVERGYCCPQALADAWEDFRDDPAAACEVMKRYLELDVREVYRIWFAVEDTAWEVKHPITKTLRPLRPSMAALTDAFFAYRNGKADGLLDFLLVNA